MMIILKWWYWKRDEKRNKRHKKSSLLIRRRRRGASRVNGKRQWYGQRWAFMTSHLLLENRCGEDHGSYEKQSGSDVFEGIINCPTTSYSLSPVLNECDICPELRHKQWLYVLDRSCTAKEVWRRWWCWKPWCHNNVSAQLTSRSHQLKLICKLHFNTFKQKLLSL